MPARIGPKKPQRVYLAKWREWKGLTQEALGLRIEPPVDKGTVSRWEAAPPGRLTLGVLAAYAEALGRHARDMYNLPPLTGDDELATELEFLRKRTDDVIAALRGRKAS